MVMAMGDMDPRDVEIKDGKIEGNKFSFTTTISTPNGEFKTVYNGTIEGDAIRGTAAREGGQERPLEAKRRKSAAVQGGLTDPVGPLATSGRIPPLPLKVTQPIYHRRAAVGAPHSSTWVFRCLYTFAGLALLIGRPGGAVVSTPVVSFPQDVMPVVWIHRLRGAASSYRRTHYFPARLPEI